MPCFPFFLCLVSATPLLQSDIAALYIKVGVKNIGTVFLHTDAQIPDERFLVLINDMLASGVSTLTESDCLWPFVGNFSQLQCEKAAGFRPQ